jgi:hypothetical protein
MTVTVDEPGHYQLASPTMTDRVGRPLFCASVQINKNYVSYHLMPVYGNKALRDSLSASLKKRMQGKSCFNFTIDAPRKVGGHVNDHRGGCGGSVTAPTVYWNVSAEAAMGFPLASVRHVRISWSPSVT